MKRYNRGMLLADLLTLLRSYAPETAALPNDPVGLLVEPAEQEIERIIVCLDATSHVVRIALERQAQLIVAHHPLIYHPLRRLESSDPISADVLSLARSGTGLYAMHTNWDAADGGINDTLAQRIGLNDARALGAQGEAALARIGKLAAPLLPMGFLGHLENTLDVYPTSAMRYPSDVSYFARAIESVAVCGGAGSSLAALAQEQGAQAFVTSDVRHHEFIDAAARGLLLIDAGHEATEVPGMQALAERLGRDGANLKVSFVPNWWW